MHRIPARLRSRSLLALGAVMLLAVPLTGCSLPALTELISAPTGEPTPSSERPVSPSPVAPTAPSAAPAAGSQCQLAAEAVDRILTEAQDNAPQLIAAALAGEAIDPAALLTPALESLDVAASSAADPAVLAAIAEAQTEWSGLAAEIGALQLPDLSGLAQGDLSALGDAQRYGGELSRLYTDRLPALQATGARLQAACSATEQP